MKYSLLIIIIVLPLIACTKENTEFADAVAGYEVTRDLRGEVNSYKLNNEIEGISTQDEFFTMILQKEPNDQFVLVDKSVTDNGLTCETYQQYFEGVPVRHGNYTFLKNGNIIESARGSYIRVGEINTQPSIDSAYTVNIWAKYMKVPSASYNTASAKLSIIIPAVSSGIIINKSIIKPVLAYRVYFRVVHSASSLIGYIDAVTGELIKTEPIYIF